MRAREGLTPYPAGALAGDYPEYVPASTSWVVAKSTRDTLPPPA